MHQVDFPEAYPQFRDEICGWLVAHEAPQLRPTVVQQHEPGGPEGSVAPDERSGLRLPVGKAHPDELEMVCQEISDLLPGIRHGIQRAAPQSARRLELDEDRTSGGLRERGGLVQRPVPRQVSHISSRDGFRFLFSIPASGFRLLILTCQRRNC